jgi:hypothetical protein
MVLRKGRVWRGRSRRTQASASPPLKRAIHSHIRSTQGFWELFGSHQKRGVMGRGCGTGGRAGKGNVTAGAGGSGSAGAIAATAAAAASDATGKRDLALAMRAKEHARLRDMMRREALMTKVNMSKIHRTWRRIMPNEKVSRNRQPILLAWAA